ncbi:alpha/beta hydrolase [Atopobacter phocae]|uniref:alpha/beta hydrolase n=1 Tax=Atopobacter phocae TaxID=136492 RepID=UPI000472B73F|nr:alpha/beta fold hydrolase [Atopobacter phocae]
MTNVDQLVKLKGTNQKAVILIHGFTGTPSTLKSLGSTINRAGYTVYLPLLKGHGTSVTSDLLDVEPSQWVEQLKELYEELSREGFTEIAMLGLSLGGILATKMATLLPLKASGVMCSPILKGAMNSEKLLQEFNRYVLANQMEPAAKEHILARFDEIETFASEIKPQLASIEQPFLIVQGGADDFILPDQAYDFADAMTNNQQITFKWYPNSPHIITFGPDRNELGQDIINFLNNHL